MHLFILLKVGRGALCHIHEKSQRLQESMLVCVSIVNASRYMASIDTDHDFLLHSLSIASEGCTAPSDLSRGN